MIDEISGLKYESAPQKPEGFDAEILKTVGVCPAGEPWVKWTWAMDLKKHFAGRQMHKYFDPHGVYCSAPYFVLEAWVPETVYDREEWAERRYGMLTNEFDVSRCSQVQPEPCYQHWIGFGLHQKYDATIDVLGPFPEKGTWDFIRFSRNAEDGSMMSFDEMMIAVRAWRKMNAGPAHKQRALDEYMRTSELNQLAKQKAFDEAKGQHREYLAKELAKPELGQLMSLPVGKPELKNVSKAPLPSGMASTKSGLVVPQSALEK